MTWEPHKHTFYTDTLGTRFYTTLFSFHSTLARPYIAMTYTYKQQGEEEIPHLVSDLLLTHSLYFTLRKICSSCRSIS